MSNPNKKLPSVTSLVKLNKMIVDLKLSYNETKKTVTELSNTMQFKDAIKELENVVNKCNTCRQKLDSIKADITENIYDMKKKEITKISNECKERISELKKKNVKKAINRYNNKYWMDYTKKHNKAFQDVEKEMLGFNTKDGKKHDMDKYIMYHFLPAPAAHALHTQFSKHHKKRARTEADYRNMLIDWECNRRTKPDKQLKPYQILAKYYPELKDDMIPIMKKYGIPTNEREDKINTIKKKIIKDKK